MNKILHLFAFSRSQLISPVGFVWKEVILRPTYGLYGSLISSSKSISQVSLVTPESSATQNPIAQVAQWLQASQIWPTMYPGPPQRVKMHLHWAYKSIWENTASRKRNPESVLAESIFEVCIYLPVVYLKMGSALMDVNCLFAQKSPANLINFASQIFFSQSLLMLIQNIPPSLHPFLPLSLEAFPFSSIISECLH